MSATCDNKSGAVLESFSCYSTTAKSTSRVQGVDGKFRQARSGNAVDVALQSLVHQEMTQTVLVSPSSVKLLYDVSQSFDTRSLFEQHLRKNFDHLRNKRKPYRQQHSLLSVLKVNFVDDREIFCSLYSNP